MELSISTCVLKSISRGFLWRRCPGGSHSPITVTTDRAVTLHLTLVQTKKKLKPCGKAVCDFLQGMTTLSWLDDPPKPFPAKLTDFTLTFYTFP